MKKVYLIAIIGVLSIWAQEPTAGGQILENDLPKGRANGAHSQLIARFRPAVLEDAAARLNARQNQPGSSQIYTNSRPRNGGDVLARLEPSIPERVTSNPGSRRNGLGGGRIFRRKLPGVRANYVPGEVVVKFKRNVPEELIAQLNRSYEASVIYTSPFAGFKRLRIPKARTEAEMVELYKANPDVEYAELNYIAYALWVPNDPLYSYQWHLDNAEYGGIQMENAWQLLGAPGTPGQGVTVAVVDTGVAYEDYPAPAHWHIDTYNAYGGSGYSWWCGLNDPCLATPPGYGNGWKDYLQHSFDLTGATGKVTFSYYYKYDIEWGYDFLYVDISDDGGSTWTKLKEYTDKPGGGGGKPVDWTSDSIDLTGYAGKNILLRFRFNSDDSYSDEDGIFNSDGAVYIDEIKLEDGSGTLFYDDVESGAGSWETTEYEKAPDLAGTLFVPGYDFINDDSHANDDEGHGTHVAGTIAQSTNNGLGVAGVAFNCSIMPVKVLSCAGSGTYAEVADGIYFAVDNGADVINLSLGGSAPSATLENAVAYAYNNGVTVVAAAGNDGSSTIIYPAAYDDYVIAVGATRYDQQLAYYSNYGPSLDVVAPGGQLINPVTGKRFDQNGDGYGDGVLQQTFGDTPVDWSYWFYQGTSMAAPHVSGLCALLISNGNTITPAEVKAALQDTAEDLGNPGRDDTYGYGLIDANAALSYTPVWQIYFQDWESGTPGSYSIYDGWFSKYYYTISEDYDLIDIVTDPCEPSSRGQVHQITRVDAASNYLSPLIGVTPGQRYIVSAWIRWVSGGWPFVGVSRYDADGHPIGLPLYDPNTAPRLIWLIGKGDYHMREGYSPQGDLVTAVPEADGWHYYDKIFTVPEGTAYVRIMTELWAGASRSGDPNAYFDDIAMYAIAPGSSYPD